MQSLNPQKIVGILLLLALVGCSGPGGSKLRPLPELNLDNMSTAIRAQIAGELDKLDAEPMNAEVNGQLGMLFDTYSRNEEAELFYARARYLEPERFRWVYLHGRMLAALGNSEDAIEALETALGLRAGHPGAGLALAEQYFVASDIEKSSGLYKQLIERNPSFARAHFGYGKLLFEQGDIDAAIQSLSTALRLSNRYGQVHYLLSQAYRKAGDDGKAATHLRLFERYRLFAPGHNDSLLDKVTALNISDSSRLERGLLLSAAGRHTEAAKVLEELAAGGSAAAHINLIAIYGELAQFDKSREHAELALAMAPESLELHDNIGVLEIRQRNYDAAASSFRTAIDIDPEYSTPYKNLAAALETLGDTKGAIKHFRTAVRLDPYDRQARFFLANALLLNDQPDEAITQIEVIVPYAQPETPVYLQLLGRAYERKQNYQEAIDAYQKAVIAAQARGMAEIAKQASAQLKRARRKLQR